MNNSTAEWCHNDEDREVVYESLLRYAVDGDEIQINAISLCCAVDWHYDKKQGVEIEYVGEIKTVEKWLMKKIRDEEAVSESAEAACRKDYEDHLEILQERDHDSGYDF